jgi:uncharacterized protein DUF3592
MLPIFLLVLGVAAAVGGVIMLSTSLKTRGWPVASGRIIEKTVGSSTTTGASRPGRYFEPKVKYTYSVEGKTYTGQRIGPATAAYDEDKAKRVVSELPDTVEVHYNPRDPSDAYLEPSSYGLAAIALITGIVCLLIGAGLLFVKKS